MVIIVRRVGQPHHPALHVIVMLGLRDKKVKRIVCAHQAIMAMAQLIPLACNAQQEATVMETAIHNVIVKKIIIQQLVTQQPALDHVSIVLQEVSQTGIQLVRRAHVNHNTTMRSTMDISTLTLMVERKWIFAILVLLMAADKIM